jgi:hypothetical protein
MKAALFSLITFAFLLLTCVPSVSTQCPSDKIPSQMKCCASAGMPRAVY